MPPTRRRPVIAASATLIAFVVWTALVSAGALQRVDTLLEAPRIGPHSSLGQILAAIAIVTSPTVTLTAVLGASVWAWRRRLRRLAVCLLGAAALAYASYTFVKHLVARPRPDSSFGSIITNHGPAYPSGHMVAITLFATTILTLRAVQRQQTPRLILTWLTGAALLTLVALNRWAMGAHWVSDIVGGLLAGFAISFGMLAVLGDPAVLDWLRLRSQPIAQLDKRAAIIYNPAKILEFDMFRRRVETELRVRGWKPPLWLETSVGDPGREMTRDALAKKVDLVMAVGGDGTVRTVCDELAGSGVPLGLIPAGTGNLLARNLALPLDETFAFRVAFDGEPRPIDLIRIVADDGFDQRSAVMAGMGLDAQVMDLTRPELKRLVGNAAYVVAGMQALGTAAFPVTAVVDGLEPVTRQATLALVGNVGTLQAGVQLFPQAKADDGLLDVLIASPASVVDWARVATGILGGQSVEPLEYAQSERVVLETESAVPFQLDGDVEGTTSRLEATIEPAALLVMRPRRS